MRIDSHFGNHLLGSAMLFLTIATALPAWAAAISAIMAGLLWELCDELNWRGYLSSSIFDPGGADVWDIITDVAGVAFGLIIFYALP